MQKRSKWFAAAAATALAAGPAAAGHSWENYHWPVPGTDTAFNVYTSLTADYWRSMVHDGATKDIVGDAIADWDGDDPDSSGYTDYLGPVLAGTNSTDPKKCDPINSAVRVCSAYYGYRGWLGVATIWINGDHIYQATTKLNDSYHSSGKYSSWSWRSLVACQEVGHDFGLGHQDEDFNTDATQSCMDYTDAPQNNETPDGHDYQQLDTIYTAHLNESGDGGGGGGGGGCNRRSPKCAGQDAFTFRQVGGTSATNGVSSRDWGTAVGYDAHGRPNVFALDVGGGRRKITHVTWVPGFRPQSQHFGDAH